MKKYPKYKSSGVEWIGDIPENWIINKFSRAAFFQEGPGLRNWQFKDNGIKVICVTNIVPPNIIFDKYVKYISIDEYESTYKHFTVNKGDILLASSGASWGKVAEYNDDEIVILNTSTIRLNESNEKPVDRAFIKWLIQSPYIAEHLNSLLTGSCQPNFGPTHLKQLICTYPTNIKEQIQIANYLDKKTKEIETLIANKQKLIELLQEERTAIINQAVTKGVNAKAKLKPSGVEWLGDVPEHWEVKKLKYVAAINPSQSSYEFEKNSYEEVTFLPMERVSEDGLINQSLKKKVSEVSSGFTYFEKNDIIVAKITPCFENGKGALLDNLETNFGYGSTEFHTIRASNLILKEYIYFITKSERFMTIGEAFMTGSAGQKRVPTNFLKEFKIVLPPIEEQKQIIKHIQFEQTRINNIITKTEQEIELMKEYKTALISEVVTGKVDVRDEVIK